MLDALMLRSETRRVGSLEKSVLQLQKHLFFFFFLVEKGICWTASTRSQYLKVWFGLIVNCDELFSLVRVYRLAKRQVCVLEVKVKGQRIESTLFPDSKSELLNFKMSHSHSRSLPLIKDHVFCITVFPQILFWN